MKSKVLSTAAQNISKGVDIVDGTKSNKNM
jgi:hypothetical protein